MLHRKERTHSRSVSRNNKSSRSLGLIFYILTKGYCKAKGIDATLPAIKKEIAGRDRRDAERATAPMRPAEDATVIDTSQLDIPSSIARVREIIRAAHLV